MEYKILEHLYLGSLEEEVNRHIKEGWKPQGGICFDHGLHRNYCQAIIKE